MSVLFVEGFETSADQPDVYKRGLQTATSPVNVAGIGVLPVPARTGVAGTGLYLRGPYGSSNVMPCSAAGVSDFGLLPLNQSIYSLYQAGGFALGISAGFNSLNVLQIAPGNSQQLVYDGSTYYWAITYNGAAFGVAYSSDLKNWTPTATAPGSIAQNAYISVTGSGASATIVVSNDGRAGSAPAPYYSTNLGATWTAMSVVSGAQRACAAITSGTAAFLAAGYNGGSKISYYTAANAAPTQLSVVLAGTTTYYASYLITTSNGYFIAAQAYSNINSAPYYPQGGGAPTSSFAYCATSADPTVAGNWTVLPVLSGIEMNSIVYFNGLFVVVGYGGIWTCPKGGSSWTQQVNNGSSIIWSIAMNTAGTVAVAVGQDTTTSYQSAIWTSTNGTAWTKQNRFILNTPTVTGGNNMACVMWDGSRFVATGTLNNNFIATSPDGVAWSVIYVPDYAEQTGTACLSFLGLFSGTVNPGTGIFTPWGVAAGNVSGVGFTAAAAASSLRTVTPTTVTAGALANVAGLATPVSAIASTTGQAPPSTLTHYYELSFTAVPGTVNLFNVSWTLDNGTIGTLGQFQLAATSDTGTAQAFLNLPRTGNFTVVDDLYMVNFTGAYHNNRMGVQRIYPLTAASDVGTDQFSNTLGGSNAATVAPPLSNAAGYVYATATTAQDVYATANAVPAGQVINAVQVEGFLTAQGGSAGTGTVGLQSGSIKVASPNTSTNTTTPTRAQLIQETDPNTNVPWTVSGLNAVDIVVAKTS